LRQNSNYIEIYSPQPSVSGRGLGPEAEVLAGGSHCGHGGVWVQGARAGCQLIDFQWKLGMAVSSDSCRSLKYPYVAVMLKVADHSGQVSSKSIEMTIPQFQNFYKQFKEIAAVIETV
ncbi:mCG113792, isoform CRA_b, partial [Mus musculus]